MKSLLYVIIQLVIFLLTAPLVNALIRKIKAFTQKRKGPIIFQVYFDLIKYIKKSCVVSETASYVFRITPYIYAATAIVGALFIPISSYLLPTNFTGDIILLIYLLALGRFFMMLAALDTGSVFGGMGSSREGLISSLAEPALLVGVFTLSLMSKSTSVFEITNNIESIGITIIHPSYLMIFLSLFIILIIETSRIPVDDPSTHLELTMVHEAMVLEYSGRHLALMEIGSMFKQLIFITILVNLFFPIESLGLNNFSGISLLAISIIYYLIKVFLLSILLSLVEVFTVKFRFFSVPNLAALAFILSFIGFLQQFVLGR